MHVVIISCLVITYISLLFVVEELCRFSSIEKVSLLFHLMIRWLAGWKENGFSRIEKWPSLWKLKVRLSPPEGSEAIKLFRHTKAKRKLTENFIPEPSK